MILTSGGRFAGYGFYLLKGKPVFLWNLVDLNRIRWEGAAALTPGKHTVEFDFQYDGLGAGTLAFNNMSGIGRGGTGVRKVDGKEVANQKMERTLPLILQEGGLCVDQAYFAAMVGKAKGVPTLLFRGAGLDGRGLLDG